MRSFLVQNRWYAVPAFASPRKSVTADGAQRFFNARAFYAFGLF